MDHVSWWLKLSWGLGGEGGEGEGGEGEGGEGEGAQISPYQALIVGLDSRSPG